MVKSVKGELWSQLKEAGVTFPKHYREYTVEQLEAAVDRLHGKVPEVTTQAPPVPEAPKFDPAALEAAHQALLNSETIPVTSQADDMAGIRTNTHSPDEPVRIDPATGWEWYQDEIRKAAFPKPRGRRVLRYSDPGVKTVQLRGNNGTSETFEMPGEERRVAEARITLPSYQVGIYKDPQMPFKIHVYNEERGFDLFEVEDFYGGSDMVPSDIQRKYVSNVLCYDIRTTIRAIENELRDQQLKLAAGRPTR